MDFFVICYSFANCALEGAPFVRRIPSMEHSVVNMRTEGVLKLLAGEPVSLCDDDRNTFFASDHWKAYLERNGWEEHPYRDNFGTFDPIDPAEDDVFLWTPFPDCNVSLVRARCRDGSVYPYMNTPIPNVFPSHPRTTFAAVQENWKRLAERLAHVRRKAVILYRPDNMGPPAFETEERRASAAERNNTYNQKAAEILGSLGWAIFSILPDAKKGDPFWGHFSDTSLQILYREIDRRFGLRAIMAT